MATAKRKLSVDELRRRFAGGEEVISSRLLNQLKRDPRDGARKLYATLKQRQERDRLERLRLDGMLNFERVLWRSGVRAIAGVDEVGVGPLAGPVVAAAVVFPPGAELHGVDDSKKVDRDRRTHLAERIREVAVAVSIASADVGEIDRLNIYHAALLAMRRAVEALAVIPQHVLVDARTIPELPMPQNAFNKGDGINYSIAAASIIAKVHRDELMEGLDRTYPEYGFGRHMGYSTAEHFAAVRRHGPCPIHRMSYPVIRELCGEFSPRFYDLKSRLERARAAGELRELEQDVAACRDDLAEEEGRKLRLMLSRRWNTL
jgi:ribonuclease HII